MDRSAAETLALKVLTFLAGESDELGRFLALSGLLPEELRERAGDKLLLAFSKGEGADAKLVHAARRALPGAAPEM